MISLPIQVRHEDFFHLHPESSNQGPKIVAVMGSTGSGKSTFVKQLTGCDDIVIGENIESETSEVAAYTALIDGVEFQILDTPGFDESGGKGREFKSDADVLQEISRYLTYASEKNALLTGIIYIHSIANPRVGGSTTKTIRLFKELCGEDFYTNVAIATTRWDMVQAEVEMKKAVQREGQLQNSIFKLFLDKGAKYARLVTEGDGIALMKEFIHKPAQSTKLQVEIVKNHMPLNQTSAGLVLEDELKALQIRLDREIAELKNEAKLANQAKDKAMEDLIKNEQQKTEEQFKLLNLKIQETHQTLDTMKKRMNEENKRNKKKAEVERMVMLREAQEKEREKQAIRTQLLLEKQLQEQESEKERAREEYLILERETEETREAMERQKRELKAMTVFKFCDVCDRLTLFLISSAE
ncbi:P-loop containing nucleoside triphosphate hydrolase protein [Obelidium mucronatum]|nr:P-loop containing nucleoside triphosphate hydrolase protein [Obelidium mucronatum]